MPKSRAEFLTSPVLTKAGFRHAFFTRNGGASAGEYASLNFSYAVGDAADNVRENFRRGADALELPPDRLYFVSQVHGSGVVELNGQELHAEAMLREADAVVSGAPTLACCVRTADCLPVLLADQSTGRVAAVHAGWRGLVREVIEAALSGLGGVPADWVAAIGPHIRSPSFEVSEDVAGELQGCSSATDAVDRTHLKPHVSLEQIAKAQLVDAGLRPSAVDILPGCTFAERELFFSYRRQGQASGRHLSAIRPREGVHQGRSASVAGAHN